MIMGNGAESIRARFHRAINVTTLTSTTKKVKQRTHYSKKNEKKNNTKDLHSSAFISSIEQRTTRRLFRTETTLNTVIHH